MPFAEIIFTQFISAPFFFRNIFLTFINKKTAYPPITLYFQPERYALTDSIMEKVLLSIIWLIQNLNLRCLGYSLSIRQIKMGNAILFSTKGNFHCNKATVYKTKS